MGSLLLRDPSKEVEQALLTQLRPYANICCTGAVNCVLLAYLAVIDFVNGNADDYEYFDRTFRTYQEKAVDTRLHGGHRAGRGV
jgi:hypothetical protein